MTAASPLTLGAFPDASGVRFCLWAPTAQKVDVVLESSPSAQSVALGKDTNGYFRGFVPNLKSNTLYRYRVDGKGPFPDPTSRFQPQGVHGPSEIVDPKTFQWTDKAWKGVPWKKLSFYEVHVGTFSSEGTFEGVRKKLPYLKDLGITAVELMPVADFPGDRNWGYDGVSLFAPSRAYGRPEDLRRLVDTAHGLGLSLFLDVVYNHLGPDGNYLGAYSPHYFTERHKSSWGAGVNLDGPESGPVRRFFSENALRWIEEYHIDGLRLDATHALMDDSPTHFLTELTETVEKRFPDRQVYLVAEDHRNLNDMVRPRTEGGWGLDAVWADDLHHQVRVHLAGDRDGYYADFSGTINDIAETVRHGWFFCGQHSKHLGEPRGTAPVSPERCVVCIQNHDQVGNRALGDRLNHGIDPAAYRAATALLLTAPEIPLLFMGQEFASSSPFLYFTDHNEELGRLVTQGRREEFKSFKAFADPAIRNNIPDPQALATFEKSRLIWEERNRSPHREMESFYRALLVFRQQSGFLDEGKSLKVSTPDTETLVFERPTSLVILRLKGSGTCEFKNEGNPWERAFSSEDKQFSDSPLPLHVEISPVKIAVTFHQPGAVIFKRKR
ncbi:MAG: malto-oligosyltrehalose trehalohydrolase [Elusimicrobia bacterium]|nr:malto-oligosyltrehalose trehalohydrolase [Elusimicrobiota bacterium]